MPIRKNGKTEPIRTIQVKTDEISVAKSRSSEPYIKSLIATPENVAQESLGTLVGVFSVSDRSESSGFVVNMLVSAIRKEYFANPRRGAVESFEAALHKMNLTLSELVKNGQTEWIGKLHGVAAAIEKNGIHFSVTGAGRILLFRGGSLQDIGDGLAPEEAATHPLKTFVEISSGRLSQDDCVFLASPEVFALFTDDALERNARRLIPERKFFRFLETAMTNELQQGSAIVLSVEEHLEETIAPTRAPRDPKRQKEKTRNVFSAETFKQAAEKRAEIFREETPPLQTDPERDSRSRFGDIYVRGEEPENKEEHPIITKLRWTLEDAQSSFRNLRHRTKEGVRQRQEAISVAISGNIAASFRRAKRAVKPSIPNKTVPKSVPIKISVLEKRVIRQEIQTVPTETTPSKRRFPTIRIPDLPAVHIPDLPIGRAKLFVSEFISNAVIPTSKEVIRTTGSGIGMATRETGKRYMLLRKQFFALPPKHQLLITSAAAFVLTIGGISLWNTSKEKASEPVPIIITESPTPMFPPGNEPNATLAAPETVTSIQDDIVSPIFLKNTLYLVTGNGVHDTKSNDSFVVPSGGDTIRYAAGMDDLDLIFLMTAQGRTFAFAPSNRSFVENTLRLPSEFRPAGIGTFLTYLYVLEEGTGRIYRFPRAEGGFGDGLLWTKEPMASETRGIAVSEHIYGATTTRIQAFLRGKISTEFSLEAPAAPLSIIALCANEESPDRLSIVDTETKRIIVYGSDGHIISQHFHESFSDASACALSQDGNTVAVSMGKSASIIRLTE